MRQRRVCGITIQRGGGGGGVIKVIMGGAGGIQNKRAFLRGGRICFPSWKHLALCPKG